MPTVSGRTSRWGRRGWRTSKFTNAPCFRGAARGRAVNTLLQVTAVRKAFAGVQALRGVSFDLRAGEVHALVGENGAGKSTLIKIITGAHRADEGTLTLSGRTVHALDPAGARALGVAAIYQQPALFPDLTVAEN